jgi:hypothetical protein
LPLEEAQRSVLSISLLLFDEQRGASQEKIIHKLNNCKIASLLCYDVGWRTA